MGQGLQQCSDEYRTMIIELVTPYYENDAKKLTEFVDWVIKKKFGGVKGKDMDLYYTLYIHLHYLFHHYQSLLFSIHHQNLKYLLLHYSN